MTKSAKATREARGPVRANNQRADSMLSAALDLFSQRDYTAVTIGDIARAAGVTHSLIYYYYPSKEALFDAAIQNSIRAAVDNYEALKIRHSDPVDLINDWFDNNIQLSSTLRKLVKILFDYSGPQDRTPSTRSAVLDFYRHERSTIEIAVQQGIEKGLFRPVDPKQVAAFVSTHIDGVFFGSMMRDDVDIDSGIQELKTQLWQQLGYHRGSKTK